jgi:hypothetical protein
MNCTLIRAEWRPDGIFGQIISDDNQFKCVTLEHAYLVQGNWMPKIPVGEYECARRLSPRFNFEVFEVLNVPNCTYIEIHPGNYNADSEGCILLGESAIEQPNGEKIISMSRQAFGQFMLMQNGLQTFKLTVV